jgi:hypothetical protein
MEYLIVLPIEPTPVRQIYPQGQSLPLHCTLMHWFRTSSGGLTELDKGIERIALEATFEQIELVSERADLFGPGNTVPVHVLAENQPLKALHEKVLSFLEEIDSLPEEQRWIGEGYRPHVTDTEFRHFPPGTRFRPTNLALIGRSEDRDKLVISSYLLGGPPF